MNAEQEFLTKSSSIIKNGTYNDIDMHCHLGKYQRFKSTEDRKISADIIHATHQVESKRAHYRKDHITHTQTITWTHKQEALKIKKEWEKTQEDKKNRVKRDLQFELATETIRGLRKIQTDTAHFKDQVCGIEAFEQNLRRNGIGGSDVPKRLEVAYEDRELFLTRIEETSKLKWPSASENSDFLTQLKQRTFEKRTARYEKIRRRRRMLVEQQNALNLGKLATNSHETEEDIQSVADVTPSSEDDDSEEETIAVSYLVLQRLQAQREAAEEAINRFADEQRALYEQSNRAGEVTDILASRALRIESKLAGKSKMCLDIVLSVLSMVLDHVGDNVSSPSTLNVKAIRAASERHNDTTTSRDASDISNLLSDFVKKNFKQASSTSNSDALTMRSVASLEGWPTCATLAGNLGKWSLVPVTQPLPPLDLSATTQTSDGIAREDSSNAATDSQFTAASPPEYLPPESSLPVQVSQVPLGADTAVDGVEDGLVGSFRKNDSNGLTHTKAAPSIDTQRYIPERMGCFLEKAQSIIEYLFQQNNGTDGEKSSTEVALPLSPEEEMQVYSMHQTVTRVILVATSNCIPSLPGRAHWDKLVSWLGGTSKVQLWDVPAALSASAAIAPSLEGKVPSANLQSLALAFFADSICSDSRLDVPLSAQALRVCLDFVETCTRVLSISKTNSDGADIPLHIPLHSFPFSEATLAIILGQSVWLRAYTCERCASALGEANGIPRTLFVSSAMFTTSIQKAGNQGRVSALFPRIFDWFLRGGSRDNIPETDPEMASAIQNEAGAGKGKGKAKGGKSQPDDMSNTWLALVALICILQPTDDDAAAEETVATIDVDVHELVAVTPAESVVGSFIQSSSSTLPESDWGAKISDFADSATADSRHLAIYSCNTGVCDAYYIPSTLHSPSESVPSRSIFFRGEVGMVETFVAIICDLSINSFSATSQIGDSSATELDSTNPHRVSVIDRVLNLRNQRRLLLPVEQRLWLLHTTGQHVVDFSLLSKAYDEICAARLMEIEKVGLILMTLLYQFISIQTSFRQRETYLVKALKSEDPRWRQACVLAQGQLGEMSAGKSPERNEDILNLILSELICGLGDVIDNRHMCWLELSSLLKEDCKIELQQLINKTSAHVDLAGEFFFSIVDAKRRAAEAVALVFETAKYETFPWVLRSDQPGSRLNLDRRRDELRSARIALLDVVGWSNSEDASFSAGTSCSLADDTWGAFASVEAPTPARSFSASAVTEVYLDSLRAASAMLSATYGEIIAMKKMFTSFFERNDQNVRMRHSYEHKILSSWAMDVTLPNISSWEARRARCHEFLSLYHFGVSDDVHHDGISCLSGLPGLVELRDMSLPLRTLKSLTEEIFRLLEIDDNIDLADVTKAEPILLAAVQASASSGAVYGNSWLRETRIFYLLSRVSSSGSFTSLTDIFRAFVMTIAFGVIPAAPSAEYIARLAGALASQSSNVAMKGLVFDSTRRVSVEATVTKALLDAKLAVGWWNSATSDEVSDILTIVAIISACKGKVIVENFILTMSVSPRLLSSDRWVQSLLCDRVGWPSSEVDDSNGSFKELPTYSIVGPFKLFYVASTVADPTNLQAISSDDACQAPAARALADLTGSRLSRGQLNWLVSMFGQHSSDPNKIDTLWGTASRSAVCVCAESSDCYRSEGDKYVRSADIIIFPTVLFFEQHNTNCTLNGL